MTAAGTPYSASARAKTSPNCFILLAPTCIRLALTERRENSRNVCRNTPCARSRDSTVLSTETPRSAAWATSALIPLAIASALTPFEQNHCAIAAAQAGAGQARPPRWRGLRAAAGQGMLRLSWWRNLLIQGGEFTDILWRMIDGDPPGWPSFRPPADFLAPYVRTVFTGLHSAGCHPHLPGRYSVSGRGVSRAVGFLSDSPPGASLRQGTRAGLSAGRVSSPLLDRNRQLLPAHRLFHRRPCASRFQSSPGISAEPRSVAAAGPGRPGGSGP